MPVKGIVYLQMARLWPFYFMFFLSLQFVLPRMFRLCISKDSTNWKWLHGTTKAGSPAAEYLSYLLISGGIVVFCSLLAVEHWSDLQTLSMHDRLYSTVPEAQLLAAVSLAYQLYNFVVCFTLPNDCGQLEQKFHHATTALLSYFVMHPYAHYYAFFFVGVAELTNVPLTLVDAGKAFPGLRTMIPTLNACTRIVFALSFFAIRLFWWPYISYQFWLQSIELLQNNTAHNNYVVFIFLVSNVSVFLFVVCFVVDVDVGGLLWVIEHSLR